ncbi:hypothetical protein QNJ95_44170 [Bradyrhizobium elkanii]|uniref:hypothetical protein n=1 Tax=Bradyrhizobium elkanii TaxID=29448 RepID=UPI00271202BC|nr:hypothetical protein [Bradyrhizobium elkanii]WLA39752.1 hypothetical protein QNJ95_44170 [Bradyrhizobium elkanii]
MNTLLVDLNGYIQPILDWTERHAGLAGWVGAIGAILAVFVTWVIARNEYLRDRRRKIEQSRQEIVLLRGIMREFEDLLQLYVKAARNDASEAISFYNRHLNDAQMHAARDLAHIPVTEWPTFATYCSFKRYWFFSLQVLETSNVQPINKSDLETKMKRHDDWLEVLMQDFDRDAKRVVF